VCLKFRICAKSWESVLKVEKSNQSMLKWDICAKSWESMLKCDKCNKVC